MDVVVAIEQELGEVRSVLAREPGDQSDAIHDDSCFVGQPFPAKMVQLERGDHRGGEIEYEWQRARASSDAPKVPRRPAGLSRDSLMGC